MALQDRCSSAEKFSGLSLGNIALVLFSTAVQATVLKTKNQVMVDCERWFLYFRKSASWRNHYYCLEPFVQALQSSSMYTGQKILTGNNTHFEIG